MVEESTLYDDLEQGSNDAPLEEDNTPNLLKGLISDNEFEKKFKENFEFIFNKDVTLSFQDDKSKKEKLIHFDILKIDTLFSTPYDSYDFDMETRFNKMKFILDTKLDRAKGFRDGRRVNERIAQQSQFSEAKQIQQQQNEGGGGFLSKLLRRNK